MPDESKERGLWNAKVIFVLGGPGAAKGTQCSRIVSSYQIHYFSIGDVLRAELAKVESQYANIIRQNMSEGRVGPPEITLALLKAAMSEKAVKGEETVFLVGGFPRKMDQAQLFESTICSPTAVLYLKCPGSIQQDRLLCRACTSDRFDVLEFYKKQGKVRQVDASKEEAEVYRSIEVAMQDLIEPLQQPATVLSSMG